MSRPRPELINRPNFITLANLKFPSKHIFSKRGIECSPVVSTTSLDDTDVQKEKEPK